MAKRVVNRELMPKCQTAVTIFWFDFVYLDQLLDGFIFYEIVIQAPKSLLTLQMLLHVPYLYISNVSYERKQINDNGHVTLICWKLNFLNVSNESKQVNEKVMPHLYA